MKAGIKEIIVSSIEAAFKSGVLKNIGDKRLPDIIIERSKKEEFGDFSTNVAMLLASVTKEPPKKIAEALKTIVGKDAHVERCEVAGPGFLNIFLKKTCWAEILRDIIKKGPAFGKGEHGKGKKVLLEFVSANPTGPLHIGHGRGAAVGDALANILKCAGFEVTKEFYVNDRGRQIETLGASVYARYMGLCGNSVPFPEDGYKGDYIKEIAEELRSKHGDKYAVGAKSPISVFSEFAKEKLLQRIKKDLTDFSVTFDNWYSETSLYDRNLVEKAIDELKAKGVVYEEGGAQWFKTTEYGDDKDRVLKKATNETTYLASDVAYHREKALAGYGALINIWGADHHGYEGRIRAALKALFNDDSSLKIIFIQLVALLRDGAPVPMGKREGEFVTLKQVVDEVGKDACRFFFLMRKSDAHLDFDLELAKKQAPENPVFYVQYCHARIKSICQFADEKGVGAPPAPELKTLERLSGKDEIELIRHLSAFEAIVEKCALDLEPHRLTFYLTELAGLFHPYYNKNRVVTDDPVLTIARLSLCKAVAGVIRSGLALLGVNAPDKM